MIEAVRLEPSSLVPLERSGGSVWVVGEEGHVDCVLDRQLPVGIADPRLPVSSRRQALT